MPEGTLTECAGIAQLVEQLICNWIKGVCTALQGFAFRPETLMNTCLRGDWALRSFARFSAEIHGDRRKRP
jgi:hypothetical protein